MKILRKMAGKGPEYVTLISGKVSKSGLRSLRGIAKQLGEDEAGALEWALKRCGLRIKIPSKFYPED